MTHLLSAGFIISYLGLSGGFANIWNIYSDTFQMTLRSLCSRQIIEQTANETLTQTAPECISEAFILPLDLRLHNQSTPLSLLSHLIFAFPPSNT